MHCLAHEFLQYFMLSSSNNSLFSFQPIAMPGETNHNLNVEEKRNKFRSEGRMSMNDERSMRGDRPSMGRGGSSGSMMRGRGGEGGGMSRGGRGGGMRGGSESGVRGGMMSRGLGGSSYSSRR